MNCFVRLLVIGATLCATACANLAGSGPAPKIDPQAQAVAEYRIGVDDSIRVAVWQNPDLNVTVPVRPDGKISVPLVGDVEAGGRTTADVGAEIKSRLAQFIRDPQVTVIVDQLRSHEYLSRVRVTGASDTELELTVEPVK